MRHGTGWKVMVALLAGGVLAAGCRPENPQGSRTQDPINQQQKSPAAGYTKQTGPTQPGAPTPENSQEHPAHTGTGEQTRKAQEMPGGKLGEAANESAQDQLEQMKKEEQEKNQATGGSGAQDDTDER